VLTLPNGDYIEGQFNGSFSDGIKVNGMFRKDALDHSTDNRLVTSGNNLTFPKYVLFCFILKYLLLLISMFKSILCCIFDRSLNIN